MKARAGGRVGRPAGPHDDTLAKLVPAARHLFLTEGGAALTPTRLHKETGVARATIYRNWPHPADLIEVIVAEAIDELDSLPPSGGEGEERTLRAAAQQLADQLGDERIQALLAACLEYGRISGPVAATAERFVDALLAPLREGVGLAVADGSVGANPDALVASIAGSLLLDRVFLRISTGAPHTPQPVDHLLDHALAHPPP